jgi:hypothetical protein
MCINNISVDNLIYDDKYINGELITTFKINFLNNTKPKPKLYMTNKSYRYNFNYSIVNNKISDKHSELKECTITEQNNKVEIDNRYYIKQLSYDLILMSDLMVKYKSTNYINKHKINVFNNFDYLELQLISNYISITSKTSITSVKLTAYINNDNIDVINNVEDIKLDNNNISFIDKVEDVKLENIIIKEDEDIKLENIIHTVKIEDVKIKENLINIISYKKCPISGIPDNIYLERDFTTKMIDKYYRFISINNIHTDNLTFEEEYINGELITTFKINLLNHIKQKLKLQLFTETDISECYKYHYSIDNGKVSEKYGELKGRDTIHKISYEKFDKIEKGNKYYMKQISSDKVVMSNLMIKNKSTNYKAIYRATPINNFDYLELRLMYNTIKLIKVKPIQIIPHTNIINIVKVKSKLYDKTKNIIINNIYNTNLRIDLIDHIFNNYISTKPSLYNKIDNNDYYNSKLF